MTELAGNNSDPSRARAQSYTEFIIRRKELGQPVTAEKDFQDGFMISGPGLDGRMVRFIEWSEDATAEAETPWGRMHVRVRKPSYWKWVVEREGESSVDVEMEVKTYVDFLLSGNVKLRFKNRTQFGGSLYRFKDRGGKIEIRTRTIGLLSSNPFPSERKKIWRIRFVGQLSVDWRSVLPSLAVWLCYYKIYRRSYPAFYDSMF